MNRDGNGLLVWALLCLLWLCICILATSCVRSVTTCVTYDHALGRVDPNVGAARDGAGASVCAEVGSRE